MRKAELIALLQNSTPQAQIRRRPPHPNRFSPPPPQRHAKALEGPRALLPAPAPWMSPSGASPRGATWELECEQETKVRQHELEAGSRGTPLLIPLMKRQLKHMQNRDSKLAKKSKSLEAEIGNLKSRLDTLEDRIMRASKSTSTRFKRKKIRSMKHEVEKITEKLTKSENDLRAVEPKVPKNPISKAPSNYILQIGIDA